MSAVAEVAGVLPRMVRVRQKLFSAPLSDEHLAKLVVEQMARLNLPKVVKPGESVAIGAGSRGIDRYAAIVKLVVEQFQAVGGKPFVFPAMGSHGGATADGQRGVLASLGITEASVGCPVNSEMDVAILGTTPHDMPVYLDKNAAAADHVFIVNRVKPHTNFRGHVESGLMKMLAIGAGKHVQASTIHRYGQPGLRDHMPEVARAVMANAPVIGGLAILEDALHTCCRVVALAAGHLEESEAKLLEEVRGWQPKLPVDELDVLVVDRIGKELSGTGMDPNVIGRCRLIDFNAFDSPRIAAIVLLDMTEKTAGNALGVGMADIVTRRVAQKYDLHKTSTNALVGFSPAMAALPLAKENDREALITAIDFLVAPTPPEALRAIRIRDTLNLETMDVSEAVAAQIADREEIEVCGELGDIAFDEQGNFSQGW